MLKQVLSEDEKKKQAEQAERERQRLAEQTRINEEQAKMGNNINVDRDNYGFSPRNSLTSSMEDKPRQQRKPTMGLLPNNKPSLLSQTVNPSSNYQFQSMPMSSPPGFTSPKGMRKDDDYMMRYPSDTLSPRPLPRGMGYSRDSPLPPSMSQDRDKIMTERGLPLERGIPPERMDRLDRGMSDRMQERGLPLERSPIPSTSPSMLKRDRSPPVMQNSMGSKSQFSGQARPVYSYSSSGVNNMSNSNYIPNTYDRKVGYNPVIDPPMQHQPNYHQQNMGLLNLTSLSSLPPNLQMQLLQAQLMRSPNLFPAGQPIPISGRGSGLPLQPNTHRPNPKMWNGSQNKKW